MQLSLRWKIVGGFTLLIVLIALLGWITFSLLSSLTTVQRRVFDRAVPGLVAVDEIVRSYTAQSAAVYRYLIEANPSLLAQYEREVATANVYQRRADSLFTAREEEELLNDLVEAGDSFQVLVDDHVVPLHAEGRRSAAFRVLGEDGSPLISQIETLGQLLRETQDRAVITSQRDLQLRSDATIIALIALTVGALAVGITMAVILPRHLVSDLSKLVDAARAVGRGEFDHQIDIQSRDEVGEVASRFREMQVGLKKLQQLALQESELAIAASIQRNLLQRTIPDTPGARLVPLQRQANLVGGDWYNVEVTGHTLSVVVGDASGKGIAAALMATLALSALRAERGRGATPTQVIESANRTLREATDSESFTTLIYSTIDLTSGEARWMNMGHHSPFIIRGPAAASDLKGMTPSPRGYYLEGPRNRALGWFEEPGLAETVVNLEPGDRLVLFTDGYLEAKSTQGEVFGEHRFAELLVSLAPLASEALVDEVVAEVERFAAGKLDDDLTMLVIEWLGAPTGEGSERSGEQRWHSRR
jgi:serine phosphatase RsbU (regulator of sigma subunit)